MGWWGKLQSDIIKVVRCRYLHLQKSINLIKKQKESKKKTEKKGQSLSLSPSFIYLSIVLIPPLTMSHILRFALVRLSSSPLLYSGLFAVTYVSNVSAYAKDFPTLLCLMSPCCGLKFFPCQGADPAVKGPHASFFLNTSLGVWWMMLMNSVG